MKAIVILRDGTRHDDVNIDDAWARHPALDFALPFDSSWYIASGTPTPLDAHEHVRCYRSGAENGVPVFRER